jgi:hypothetical protein
MDKSGAEGKIISDSSFGRVINIRGVERASRRMILYIEKQLRCLREAPAVGPTNNR